MARRVEAQINRDWHFGFVTWNYMFRSAVNLSRTWFAYDRPQATDDGFHKFTAKDLETGAIQICKALWSKYRDVDGKKKSVNGDMTKVRYVPGLCPAAQKLLQNTQAGDSPARKKRVVSCVSTPMPIACVMVCQFL